MASATEVASAGAWTGPMSVARPSPRVVVKRVQGIVRDLMAEKGYEFAEVTPSVEPLPAGPWDARIALSSGFLERKARATITFPDAGASEAVDPREAQLRASEGKFRRLADANLVGVAFTRADGGVLDVRAGQAVVTKPGEWVRYSSPEPGGAEYIAVCVPAYTFIVTVGFRGDFAALGVLAVLIVALGTYLSHRFLVNRAADLDRL